MSDKFLGKYRNESARLQTWDYGSNGAYFITICTHERICFFGDIENGIMHRNEIGNVAHDIWMEIPKQFGFVELGEFVVMPDHVHGILVINKTTIDIPPIGGGITGHKNPMLHENISRVIRWYKGRCSFEIRKIHSDFAWQTRFHDHIIRNDVSYTRITNYIAKNPVNWKKEKLKECLAESNTENEHTNEPLAQ